jgi:hypothetical protein
MKAPLYLSISLAFISLMFGSCSSYKFVAMGQNASVLQEDSTYQQCIINNGLKLKIELPGDFNNYKVKTDKGLKLTAFYTGDKRMLRKLHLKPSQTQILFSAKPTLEPYYNLVGFINTGDTAHLGFDKKMEGNKILYYYKKTGTGGMQLAEALIPYGNQYVGFIYYSFDRSCSFCDFDATVSRNAKIIGNKAN